MIPPEIYSYAFAFFTFFGGASLLLGLAGFAAAGITAILEAFDDIKCRIRGYLFTREMKRLSEKHKAELLAKEEDIA